MGLQCSPALERNRRCRRTRLPFACTLPGRSTGAACPGLAAWDTHSKVGSRGNQICVVFVTRLPTLPVVGTESYWQVPFDENDPVNTPRALD